MYIKVKREDSVFCDASYYLRVLDKWTPHNKYGEDITSGIYIQPGDNTVYTWLDDGDIEFLPGIPKFERKIEFPLVIKSTVYIWIMENEKDGLCLLTNGQKKEKSYCKASNLIGDCKRNPSEFKELKGNERDLVLMMYKYVK